MYTVLNFRYTGSGWVATIQYDNAPLSVTVPLKNVDARDARNFQQAYITCACLPYDAEWGAVVDVEPPTVSEAVSVQYGESELQAQHDDWKDLRRTEEDARL